MEKTVFIIGYIWPEPNTTAAGHRMLQLIHFFNSQDYQITVGSTAVRTEHSFDLDSLGVKTVFLKLNHSSFDTLIKDLQPTFVVFDRFMIEEQFGWRVAEFSPISVRILNTEDLHSLRTVREVCVKKGEQFTMEKWKNHPKTLREVASIYRSDITLLISSYETEILKTELHISEQLLLYLPFHLKRIFSMTRANWPTFEARKDFVSVGNGKHAPNVDSLMVLKGSIWPLIKKALPEAKLFVYGAYLPQQVLEMHNPKEGFYIMGWIEDLEAALQNARVLLAPLRFGAGIKGKLVDAMKNGTPSITTIIGAEGINENSIWNGTITSSMEWEGFAEAAVDLYTNKAKWKKAQENGVKIINEIFVKNLWDERLKTHLGTVSNNLDNHRNENIIGKLVQQEALASTKYMAKWIEAKNRG
ncbi:hypothetical protein HME9304_03104 [Flagellimonas maritima]|uniref:Glycosyltransferase n=1 Tax=Flagellimonas maritima TaxID=1383885 RepID=A0A2Z4LWA7_9FLAO|nr:glycosyltransferase [Allomuricauda aurantiaca]AWX46072.1 hypothetical protein HME9304_03104 [Allomuricauda aurantiaca]